MVDDRTQILILQPYISGNHLVCILRLAVAQPGPIPPEEVPQAVDAANACPVSAIRIEE